MIIPPLSSESAIVHAPLSVKRSADPGVLKLLVLGFTPAERNLLDGLIALSQRRPPRIDVITLVAFDEADIVLIDTAHTEALAWAALQPGLEDKTVIWVDAQSAPATHTLIRRPVQWASLSVLLHQALERRGSHRHDPVPQTEH